MTFFWIMLLTISWFYILHRVFIQKEFLFWNWQNGMKWIWEAHRDEEE